MTDRGNRFPARFLILAVAVALWLVLGSPPLQQGAASPPEAVAADSTGTTLYLPLILNSPLPPAELEVTQAVQQPGNPVTLIAGRPTFVRYTLTDDTPYSGVEALLYGSRDGSPLPGSPISAFNNPRTLQAVANRASLESTFNFELPASWTSGTVALWTSAENGTDYQLYEGPVTLTFQPNGPLPITLVPLAYTCTSGGTGTVTPSPPYDYIDDYTFKIYPVPGTDLQVHAPAAYAGPCTNGLPTPTYNTTDGGDWRAMLDLVSTIRTTEGGTDRYYYGLVQIDCGGSCVSGIGWIGWGAAVGWNGSNAAHSGASNTHAHEVGHNHGLKHAPGCGASGVDTAFPYLDGSGRALIGDAAHPNYGLDIDTLAIKVYTAYYDFMSYCNPDWISDYNYEALYAYEAASPAASISRTAGESLLVSGTLLPAGTVRFEPAFTLPLPGSEPAPGPYTLELLDSAGGALASYPFEMASAAVDSSGGGPDGELRGFQLVVPAPPGVDSLRVVHAGGTVGELRHAQAQANAPGGPPQAAIEHGLLKFGSGAVPAAAYLARISLDGGSTWQVIAAGPAAGPIDLGAFAGRSVTVQVFASSGLDTQQITLGPVVIP